MGLFQQILHIAKHLKGRVVRQVILKVTVTAIHGAIAGKVDNKIIAAYGSVAAGTLLEKLSPMARQQKPLLALS
jgi:hypothetical protein